MDGIQATVISELSKEVWYLEVIAISRIIEITNDAFTKVEIIGKYLTSIRCLLMMIEIDLPKVNGIIRSRKIELARVRINIVTNTKIEVGIE